LSEPTPAAQGATDDFLLAARTAAELIGRVEVMQRWNEPSALDQMTVGAVAAHLGSQVLSVHAVLTTGEGVSTESPVTLLEHYDRAGWVRAGVDDEDNLSIRDRAAASAEDGHGVLVDAVQHAFDDIRTALTSTMQLPPAVRMPWWDYSLSFGDFLLTRLMEVVVHADDLAVSVDVDPPVFPETVMGPVLAVLVGISMRRHGQAAVVRTLSRRERAPASISAF
jgi:hypothetical protein